VDGWATHGSPEGGVTSPEGVGLEGRMKVFLREVGSSDEENNQLQIKGKVSEVARIWAQKQSL